MWNQMTHKNKMCNEMITEGVRLAVKNEKLFDYTMDVHENIRKDDGYMGRIAFVTVTGLNKSGEKKILHMVIKAAMSSKLVRKEAPIGEIFGKEIYIYEDVVSAFKSFQKETGIENNFSDVLPPCYATQLIEGKELIVLQNMKSEGFAMWDRTIPMTYDHIKLVLQAYGQWHAISLALKHKKPETFRKLVTKNNQNMWPYFIAKVGIDRAIFDLYNEIKKVWQNEQEVAEGITFSQTDVTNIFSNINAEDPDYQVILHGDPWTNNFLFQNQEDTKVPKSIRIIDWQMSGVASPVLDLSYFMYACVDTEIYRDAKELLAIYYSGLSNCLRQFGCDPFEVLSYDKLVEHWKQFSNYGVLLGTFILKFSLSESGEVVDYEEMVTRGGGFLDTMYFTIVRNEKYHQRAKNNFLHYIRNSK